MLSRQHVGNILTKSDQGSYSYEGDQNPGNLYQLYDDSIASGWADQSWASSVDPDDTTPVYEGSKSIEVVYASPWQGLKYKTTSFDTGDYDDLELAVNVGTNTTTNLYLYFRDDTDALLDVVNLDSYNGGSWSSNTWEALSIPLTDLDMDNRTGTTSFHIESDTAATINYDDIKFTSEGGGENYANPHAATLIGGTTYTYDRNGNVTSYGNTTNTWNYKNHLTRSVSNGTTTYTYDHTGQRVSKDNGTTITYYPFTNYEVSDTGTTTKHIYAGDMLVATIEDDTPSPKTYYNHLDHLNSTNVTTDIYGYTTQLLSYYPFGSARIDDQLGDLNQTKRFTGHDYDSETNLTYAGARYLNSDTGKWTSMDPASRDNPNQFLRDPQQLNTYSYGRNNPLILVDPTGEKVELFSRPVYSTSIGNRNINIGAHTFFLVTPDNPNDIQIDGVPAGASSFTFGGYNRDGSHPLTNKLTKGIGTPDSRNTDSPYAFGGRASYGSTVITPPNGMSDSEFINSMGSEYNKIDLSGMNYNFTGNKRGLYNGNSNNFAYTLGVNSGVQSQMDAFNPAGNFAQPAPGYGQSLPSTSIYRQLQSALNSLKSKLDKLKSS